MSLMTSRLVFYVRRVMRALGLPRLLTLFAGRYETALSRRLFAACHQGDVAWDIGANVGYFTTRLSEWVGPRGKVFAFEPCPANVSLLRSACERKSNVVIREYGLSNKTARARFMEGSDNLRATSRVLEKDDSQPEGMIEVELRTGDGIIGQRDADIPNIVKIDVEGHELHVLEGLRSTLSRSQLRSVFVEVHFGILDSCDRSEDPRLIETLLKQSGFKIRWIDASHLHAYREARSARATSRAAEGRCANGCLTS
jgi:FkbM family methyltransferase